MGLVSHRLPNLMGSWDVLGPGLQVSKQLLGFHAQAGHVTKFGEVALDGLLGAADVEIFSIADVAEQLPCPICNRLVDLVLLLLGLCHRRRVDGGVLLQVHLGAEEVVPEREAERPVTFGPCLLPRSES